MVASAGCLSMPLLRHHLAPFSAKLFAINSSRIPPQPKPPSGAKSGLMREIYGHSPTPDEYLRAFRRYGGNETEFLCYDCLTISRIDVEIDLRICSSCKSAALRAASRLAQTKCPNCRQGHFDAGKMTGVS